jgi:tRNA/tmRNA/rRNA uracil-C5-methylase (TrmA/RlmC/RlmD family)
VWFLKQNRRPAHALDGACTHLWGTKTLDDTLLGLTFALSPQSFFQINPEQTEVLYQKALDAAGIRTRVVSLPCFELFFDQPGAYRAETIGTAPVKIAMPSLRS